MARRSRTPRVRGLVLLADKRIHACRRTMPDTRKAVRHTLEILAIAVPLAATTYFLFDPEAFNAFLDWLFKPH
jgi:hypothetical protein